MWPPPAARHEAERRGHRDGWRDGWQLTAAGATRSSWSAAFSSQWALKRPAPPRRGGCQPRGRCDVDGLLDLPGRGA